MARNLTRERKRYDVLSKDFDTMAEIFKKASKDIDAKNAEAKTEADKIYEETWLQLHTACKMGKPLNTDNTVFWGRNKYQDHIITNYHALKINKISSRN